MFFPLKNYFPLLHLSKTNQVPTCANLFAATFGGWVVKSPELRFLDCKRVTLYKTLNRFRHVYDSIYDKSYCLQSALP
jgi:hypothetical protein